MEVVSAEIPPESWAKLAEGGPLFTTVAWFKATHERAAGTPHFFLLDDLGIAGMVADTSEFDAPVNIYELLNGTPPWMPLTDESIELRSKVTESAPPIESWFPNLVVTLPAAACLTVGPGEDSRQKVDQLVGEVIDWARNRRMSSISFLYVPPNEKVLQTSLLNRGLVRLPLTLNCELSIPGMSFDDYLESLPGGRRNSVRRELREVADSGLVIRRRPLDECLEEVVRLRLSLKKKYGRSQNEPKARRAFTGLMENFPPDNLFLFSAEADGSMVSFSLYLAKGTTWHALLTGTEYDDPRWKFAYFDLLFYTPIRHAYEAGARLLDLGGASWEAKRNRGADLFRWYGFILPLDPELEEAVSESARVTELRF